jgi:alkyl hydroperoxide reductase subunit AhpC
VSAPTTTDQVVGDQIVDARDHVDSAYYYAAGVGRDTDRAVAEIDASVRLLQAARQRLTAGK